MHDAISVTFSYAAAKDLESAADWIKQDSIEAALEFSELIRTKCLHELPQTPRMGKLIKQRQHDQLRGLVVGHYWLLYLLSEKDKIISIVRLLHSSRNLDDLADQI